MRTELIKDFLNEVTLKDTDEILLGNKASLIGWTTKQDSSYIEVSFYLCGEYKDIDISIFDLISFVYSKLSV